MTSSTSRLYRWLRGTRAPVGMILMYHRITDGINDPWGLCVSPRHFAEHLEVLQRNASVVPLSQLARNVSREQITHGDVVITFDDGYADNFENGLPLLRREGTPATFFLTTGLLDANREFWWDELEGLLFQSGELPEALDVTVDGVRYRWELTRDVAADGVAPDSQWRTWDSPPTVRHKAYLDLWEQLYTLPESGKQRVLEALFSAAGVTRGIRSTHRLLSRSEIAELARYEFVEIGAHSVTHTGLSLLSPDDQKREVAESKACLEEILGRGILGFSYPHGAHDDSTLAAIRDAGIGYACTTSHAPVGPQSDVLRLPRVQVLDWDGDEFARQLSAWLETPVERNSDIGAARNGD